MDMAWLILGVSTVLFIFGMTTNRRKISASSGGVAIGGDNNGLIKTNSAPPQTSYFWTIFNLITGITSLLSFAFIFWPIK